LLDPKQEKEQAAKDTFSWRLFFSLSLLFYSPAVVEHAA